MKIRSELIQDMYDMVTNKGLCNDMHEIFEEAEKLCNKNFPEDKEDDYMCALVKLEHAAFCAGANIVLDFIAGREVQ